MTIHLACSVLINNICDSFAISLRAELNGKLTSNEIVGHISCEISHFCQLFINYGGKLEAHVTCAKYRPSPIPSGGLEIPIPLSVKKGDATKKVFSEIEHTTLNQTRLLFQPIIKTTATYCWEP